MADRYVRAAGGNWNAAATWESTPGGGETVAVPTSSDDVKFHAASGNLTINATAACKTFDMTGYNAGSIVTHDAYELRVSGDATLAAGQYEAAGVSSQLLLRASATLTTNGCQIGALSFDKSAGTLTLGDNVTFIPLVACTVTIWNGTLDLNGKTLSGNSATNRLLVRSATVGTSAAVTVGGGTCANADFMDVAFGNGGSNLDLSAITGLSGDCGGNSITGGGTLTFTTSRVCNWKTAAGGNWSDVANWDTDGAADRVPLPQDDVTFDCEFASGITVMGDVPRIGRDIDWSSATWTGTAPMWRATSSAYVFGSIICIAGLRNYSAPFTVYLWGSGAHTLTSAGFQYSNVYIECTGSYELLDALVMTYGFAIYRGSFCSGGFNMTMPFRFTMSGNGTINADIRDSTITLTASGGFWTWDFSGTNLTLLAGGSTLVSTGLDSSSTNKMGSHTFNDIICAVHTTKVNVFSGNFTFRNMTMYNAGAATVKFSGGSSVTMTGDTFVSGTDGARVVLTSSNTTPFTLNKSSDGYVSSDWLDIDYCTVDSADKWYAGANSVNSGHNGTPTWTFAAPSTGLPMYLFLSDFYRDGVEVY
jgi:hypothetical protein